MDHTLIFLGIIGMLLTVIGFGIAFYIGSKSNKPKEEISFILYGAIRAFHLSGRDGYVGSQYGAILAATGIGRLVLFRNQSLFSYGPISKKGYSRIRVRF